MPPEKKGREPLSSEVIMHKYAGGAFGAFVSCTGGYPRSVEEFETHIKDCSFCQRKIDEYKESRGGQI